MQEGSLFSTPPPAFAICGLINDDHSDWCEVVSHGSFDFHFCNNQGCWALFQVLVDHLISSLEKCLFRSFAHLSIGLLAFLLWSCISCLYIPEIKPLSVASFETIFSHSVSCLFVEKCNSKLPWDTTSHQSEWPSFISPQITNAGGGVEEREPSCTVGGNVSWYNHYGERYGGTLEIYT